MDASSRANTISAHKFGKKFQLLQAFGTPCPTTLIGDYSVLSFSVPSIDRTLNKTASFVLYQKIMIFTFSQCNSNLNLAS